MKAPALIVIDMLNDFLQTWAPASKQRLVNSTNALVGILRDRNRPVVWVRQEFQPDLRDAFPEMRAKGIRITIQGTDSTRHACVRMTAIDAYQRDWEVIVAADCVDSYDQEHHEISLRYMNGKIASVMSNDQIRAALPPAK